MKGYIYKYTYPNGKIYVGQTRKDVKVRHYEHMNASKHEDRRHVCEMAIAKYGEPQLDIIETIEVEDTEPTKLVKLLNEAEVKWIEHYDSTTKSGKGYNVLDGGKQITPIDFILQEEFDNRYKKQWDFIAIVKNALDSIGYKIFISHDKLTQEEKKCWYGYKFKDSWTLKETTFSGYYKSHKDRIKGIGFDFKENDLDEVNDDDMDYFVFQEAVDDAFDNWVEDTITHPIWRAIMKEKDKLIKSFYKKF
ncbi:MAG: hypothetical protein IKP44_00075 [Bacteroidaceae bacterium]|nr:hypothetical protein [Bacteroidaceae bacterium]